MATADTPRLASGLGPGRVLRPSQKSLPGHARSANRALVLQTIYRTGRQSRADIARATGLTRVTISELVGELIVDGIVVELGQREDARPGKPAVLVDIDRSAHQVIGLDLSGHETLRGAVLDLDANIVARADVPLAGSTGAEAEERVQKLLSALVRKATGRILGVGVGSPGIVDVDGVVNRATNLDWNRLPLQEHLHEFSGLPVVVANDANVAALAEHTFGDATPDMMLVTVGHGVGAGILVAGSLVYGSRFAAGEIGQVMVGTDMGVDVPYTREQTLENWLAVPQLEAAVHEADAAHRPRSTVLRRAGQRLGIALAPVVGALNLSEVVLSGPDELVSGHLADAVGETLRSRTMEELHNSLRVRMTSQGDDIVLRGATVLVLSRELGVS